jgi:hypothetical protein
VGRVRTSFATPLKLKGNLAKRPSSFHHRFHQFLFASADNVWEGGTVEGGGYSRLRSPYFRSRASVFLSVVCVLMCATKHHHVSSRVLGGVACARQRAERLRDARLPLRRCRVAPTLTSIAYIPILLHWMHERSCIMPVYVYLRLRVTSY